MQVRKLACGFFTIASSTEETVKAGKRVITIPSKCTEAYVPTATVNHHGMASTLRMRTTISPSGSHGELFRPYWGSSAWHSRRAKERGKTPCMKDPSLPRRVQSTPWSKQVVAVGTCASMQLLGIVSKD